MRALHCGLVPEGGCRLHRGSTGTVGVNADGYSERMAIPSGWHFQVDIIARGVEADLRMHASKQFGSSRMLSLRRFVPPYPDDPSEARYWAQGALRARRGPLRMGGRCERVVSTKTLPIPLERPRLIYLSSHSPR